jgi:ADP-ribose pyrophosphatase
MSSSRRVQIEERSRLHDDFLSVDEAILRHERFDGSMSEPVRRLSLERGDAVAAVVLERESREVLLTEQFRYPTQAKGPGWVVEAAAGVVADGEDPESALRREILEELGYRVAELERIATFYVSPGGSSERVTLYFAEVSVADRVADGGGLDDEGEDIRMVRLPLHQIDEALETNRFVDAKTIIGLMWLQQERDTAAE